MRFENEYIGLSVKEILTEKLHFSKRAIASLKNRTDGILINGNHATVRAIIKGNDVLEINCEDEKSNEEKLIPSTVLPDIIYEDESIIAINKPPFMPTHQSLGHFYDTLANSLAHYFALQNRPFVFRSVNRLDKNTSGIVLVAKDRISSAKLSTQMKENGISKSYLAILCGELQSTSGTIETYIKRREKSIILREVCDLCDEGKISITQYEVLASSNGLSLVLATPITGRTHQLRVHFAHLGAHILGDDLYGSTSNLINRHALHAYKLCFSHPDSNEYTELFAPLPTDMAEIIENHFGKEFIPNGRKK